MAGSYTIGDTEAGPQSLLPTNLRGQQQGDDGVLLGWEFDYPGVLFENFVIEQFVPGAALNDPWVPLVVVPAQQCDVDQQLALKVPTATPSGKSPDGPDGPDGASNVDRAFGIEIDRETVTDMATPENYYCVQLEGLEQGVTYQWTVRVFYHNNNTNRFDYGPRALFPRFMLAERVGLKPTVDPSTLERPAGLRGRDISMNLDSPEPEIWVLLYWEGHPAAVRYEVEHFVDEGDFTGFVGMDEYRVNTDERYGTFESIRSPRVRNNNANIICESVVVPTSSGRREHSLFDLLVLASGHDDLPTPIPPPRFALSTVSDDTFLITETPVGTPYRVFNRPPQFIDKDPSLLERTILLGATNGIKVGDPLRAVDYDSGQQLYFEMGDQQYRLREDDFVDMGHGFMPFTVNHRTGQVHVNQWYDFAPVPAGGEVVYKVVVWVYDQHGGRDSVTVTIRVTSGPEDPRTDDIPPAPYPRPPLEPEDVATPWRTAIPPDDGQEHVLFGTDGTLVPLQGDVPDKGPLASHETETPTPSPTPLQGARVVQQCHVALGNGELDGNTTYQFRVYGVASDGSRGPDSEIILVRTRGRSTMATLVPIATMEGQKLVDLQPVPQTIDEWGTSQHNLILAPVLDEVFISSGNRGRLFVAPLGPVMRENDELCPPGMPPDAPTNYGDTMGRTGITITRDKLYNLYPEAEGDVLGIRICLFGATLQSTRDVSQLLTIYRVSGMQSEQLGQYPIDILPATGNAYFNLAPIESHYVKDNRYLLRLQFTDLTPDHWSYLFTFEHADPDSKPETDDGPVLIADLTKAQEDAMDVSIGCDDITDDMFAPRMPARFPRDPAVTPLFYEETPPLLQVQADPLDDRAREMCLWVKDQKQFDMDTLHFFLSGVAPIKQSVELPTLLNDCDEQDEMIGPVAPQPDEVEPRCANNFTRFTVDLVIIDGLRGAIIGRIPSCDADDILCLRKVVDMLCTGVGMSCDNELFFNFIVIAFAIGAASMVLFAGWRDTGEIGVLYAVMAYMLLCCIMMLGILLLNIPEYQAAIPILPATIGGALVIWGRLKSRT